MIAPVQTVQLPTDSTPVATAAEMYAQLGFTVVPLHGIVNGACACGDADCSRSMGKHPVARDWQKLASSDIDTVREAFRGHRGNVGLMLGKTYVALDVDGDEGFRSLESLGELPETLVSRSGSGGEHRIFTYAVHHDAAQVTNRRVLPGLDVKTRTGQIVVAPSLHRSGNRYQWLVEAPPAVLPDSVYERIKRQPQATVVNLPFSGSSDTIERARAYMAKIDPAISGSGGHAQTFAAARAVAGWIAKGLGSGDAWALLVDYNGRCQPPWPEKDLRHKFEEAISAHTIPQIADRPKPATVTPIRPLADPASDPGPASDPRPTALDWRARLVWEVSARGTQRPSKHAENAIVVLRYHPEWAGRVRFDVHGQVVTVRDPPWHDSDRPLDVEVERPWTDADSVRFSAWIRRTLNIDLSVSDCDRAVGVASESLPYHPVRDWMAALEWDQKLRLDAWLTTYLGVPATSYASRVGRWWMVAAVARSFQPGCKADNVLILEGPQGLKKSSALRVLASSPWFSDTPLDLQSKDAYLSLQGRLIVELAELDSLKRADATRAKAFFSSECDIFRPPYGRRNVRVPRGCVFAGSTNQATYLQDRTGNRRFWPVACRAIDLEGLARDREQLWAEAVWYYQNGAAWWPNSEDEREVCEEEQASRAESDEWEGKVSVYLARCLDPKVTVGELLSGPLSLPVGQWGRCEQMRVSSILQGLGFTKRREPTGERKWFYARSS